MIVNDEHKFAFIHIPKCAGSTVRKTLAPYDNRRNYYWLEKDCGSEGQRHFAHLTPKLLSRVCPADFRLVSVYRTFSLIRDPVKRFPSSFKQFVSERRGKPFASLSEYEMRTELDNVINTLTRGVELNPRYVHFTRQSDFVYYQGQRFVDNVYRLEDMDQFYADIGRLVGTQLVAEAGSGSGVRHNTSQVYRNEFMRRTLSNVKPLVAKCLPGSVKSALRPVFFVPPSQRELGVFTSDYVNDFINSYYNADMQLYASLCEDRAPASTLGAA